MINRTDIAHQEAQTQPIFLFQKAHLIITNRDQTAFCEDCETPYPAWEDHFCWSSIEENAKLLVDQELAEIVWNTTAVYLTREEANAHGHAKSHRYPLGWRVFCVSAEGKLTEWLDFAEELLNHHGIDGV